MALDARIRELNARHRDLDKSIQDEIRKPAHDPLHLTELKRQKLKLKEQISRLKEDGPRHT
ncbi:MAG: YdcH family protein [Caulobacterales bacterium]|jgi:hypothetical protein